MSFALCISAFCIWHYYFTYLALTRVTCLVHVCLAYMAIVLYLPGTYFVTSLVYICLMYLVFIVSFPSTHLCYLPGTCVTCLVHICLTWYFLLYVSGNNDIFTWHSLMLTAWCISTLSGTCTLLTWHSLVLLAWCIFALCTWHSYLTEIITKHVLSLYWYNSPDETPVKGLL